MLRISNTGLQTLAAHCEMVSMRLVAGTPSASGGPANQATSSAVGTAYTTLCGAVTILAGRAQSSGIKAATTGAGFVGGDAVATQDIGAIGPGSNPAAGTSVWA